MKGIFTKIRTDRLSLSLSGPMLGVLLAAADFYVSPWAALFLLLAVVSLQWESTVLTIALTLPMIYFSFGTLLSIESFVIVFLVYFLLKMIRGFAAGFTLSRNKWKEYAAAFLAYGPLAIYIPFYICSHSFGTWLLLFPSVAAGALALSTYTEEKSILWDRVLVIAGFAAMTVFSCLRMFDIWHFLYLLSLPLFFLGRRIRSYAVLAFAILAGSGYLVFLL